jgi:hypothetical protein
MEWIDPLKKLPSKDGEPILILMDNEVFVGWFMKKHPYYGLGVFGIEINYENEYLTKENIDFWCPIPIKPEKGRNERIPDPRYCQDCNLHSKICIPQWICAKCEEIS